MPVQPPLMNSPVRTAAVVFAGMTLLCAACTPFVPVVAPLLFIGTCSVYCLFLALFGVGLALASRGRAFQWWCYTGAVPVLSLVGFWLLLWFGPESILRMMSGAVNFLQVVLGVWLAMGLVVAGSGWVRYIRWLVQQSRQ